MKTKIMMLVLFCTACTEKPRSTQETQKLLGQYTWAYTPPNSNIPIELTFSNDHLNAYTSCNAMGGSYKIIEQKIITPLFYGDAQACTPNIMQQEHFIRMFFCKLYPFKLNMLQVNTPNLFSKKTNKSIYLSVQKF
ncbi:META domain-containing protein [Acinetobacter sp. Marseille-Q1623]|uniref:META domain-containing protein n=1 Tax=Acinetobacter sp. Marseille-Q1623 TaxID=2697501 RepID=UPI00157B31BB|nr:META domain-containing protein [Acinetobacter sp. Marseille-Q1623]